MATSSISHLKRFHVIAIPKLPRSQVVVFLSAWPWLWEALAMALQWSFRSSLPAENPLPLRNDFALILVSTKMQNPSILANLSFKTNIACFSSTKSIMIRFFLVKLSHIFNPRPFKLKPESCRSRHPESHLNVKSLIDPSYTWLLGKKMLETTKRKSPVLTSKNKTKTNEDLRMISYLYCSSSKPRA